MDPIVRYRMIEDFQRSKNITGKQDAYHILQKITSGGDMVLVDDLPVNIRTWNSLGAKVHEVATSLKPSMIPNVFPQLSRVAKDLGCSDDQVMDAFEQTRQCFNVKHGVVSDTIVNSIQVIKEDL